MTLADYTHRGSTTITDTEMRCGTCHAWKPDAEFSKQNGEYARSRRYRASECKACAAARRKLGRARERAQREHGPDTELCSRALCAEVAEGVLTYGTWLHSIPLALHGRRRLEDERSTPLCGACLRIATGRRK